MEKKFSCSAILLSILFFILSTGLSGRAEATNCPFEPELARECTTILIGKDATADGSVMLAHTEDMDQNDSGKLWFKPRGIHAPDTTFSIPTVVIPQERVTYAYWGQGNSDPVAAKYNGAVLGGMNEFGVSFGCNFVTSKAKRIETGHGIQRYSIRKLVLERSRTALEAVKLIGELIDTYSLSESLVAFGIADPYEAWVVETTPTQWVAYRVPDDDFHVIANQYTITTKWDLSSKDLVDYATKQGWYNPNGGEPFNFKEVYGDKLHDPTNVIRENRVSATLKAKVGSITKEHLIGLMRTHYEGTDDAYYPPHDRTVRRPVCVANTQAAMVWHLRSNLPIEIGAVMWHALSSPCISVFTPIYAGSTKAPVQYLNAESTYDPNSAWWIFDSIQRVVDMDYKKLHPMINQRWNKIEKEQFSQTANIERAALIAYERGDIYKAQEILTSYTYTQLEAVFHHGKDLLRQISNELGIDYGEIGSTIHK
jgi:dipeptidase